MQYKLVLDKLIAEDKLPANFIRFYAVGLLLFILPIARPLFVSVTALSILLVVTVIFYYHKQWNAKTIGLFCFIVVSSFFIEAKGVSSGALFGSYQYDSGLGLKILDTPLIIGINWLFLVYASNAIASQIANKAAYKIVVGAALMIVYDAVMELAAPFMNMWHFDSFYPPIDNFIMWFVISLVFHSLFVLLKISSGGNAARKLFWIQIVFFLIISLYSLLLIR